MSLRLGEVGQFIRVDAAFDLSGNTDLKLMMTKPSGATLTVDKAGGVTAPAVQYTDPETGQILNANEYWEYPTVALDIDESGLWCLYGVYEDATPKVYNGAPTNFTVLDNECDEC